MSWRRLAVLAFAITLLIFAGVARGQGRYEPAEQGRQSLPSHLASPEPPGLDGPKSVDESYSKAKNPTAGRPAGYQKGCSRHRSQAGCPWTGLRAVCSAASQGAANRRLRKRLAGPGKPSILPVPVRLPVFGRIFIRSLHDDWLGQEKTAGVKGKPPGRLAASRLRLLSLFKRRIFTAIAGRKAGGCTNYL